MLKRSRAVLVTTALSLAAAAGLVCVAAATAVAHHASVAEFDMDKQVTLNGVISKVDWINPHVYIYLDVKDAQGNVTTWAMESLPTRFFHNMGLSKEMLGQGQNVTIDVRPPKIQTRHIGWIVKITYPDGHVYDFSGH